MVGNRRTLESLEALTEQNDSVYAFTMLGCVIDTSVFVAGLRSSGGASRQILRHCLKGRIQPLFGTALWMEYESVLDRDIWTTETSDAERREVLYAIAAAGKWIKISFGWRPNLTDEGDNHLIELAIAGQARAIITHNLRDLQSGELNWAGLSVWTPARTLEEFR